MHDLKHIGQERAPRPLNGCWWCYFPSVHIWRHCSVFISCCVDHCVFCICPGVCVNLCVCLYKGQSWCRSSIVVLLHWLSVLHVCLFSGFIEAHNFKQTSKWNERESFFNRFDVRCTNSMDRSNESPWKCITSVQVIRRSAISDQRSVCKHTFILHFHNVVTMAYCACKLWHEHFCIYSFFIFFLYMFLPLQTKTSLLSLLS